MYKDILVHVDTSPHCARRLDVAANLAAAHGAHLTGLFVRTHPHVPNFVMAELGPEVAEVQRKYVAEAADKAKELFNEHCERTGLNSEWREAEGDLLDVATISAKYSDLVIVGQSDPEHDTIEGEDVLPDHLVMDAGRPVLVVPYAGEFPTVGENVLVAWNGSREATRAVNDALPILKRAKKVEVLAINPKRGPGGLGDVPGADISLHLARHGVNAKAEHVVARDIDPANLLLSRISDEGIDLMVMGAYGHSRLREVILGGATYDILHHMTVPVLLSH